MFKDGQKIGLTGGIASGKSKVADYIKKSGFSVIDLDQVGRELTQTDPSIIAFIKEHCGERVFVDEKLDRKALKAQLFSNPTLKTRLEKLIHPKVRTEFERRCKELFSKGTRVVFCEAALLVEGNYHETLDKLILVVAPKAIKKERLLLRDEISDTLAEKIFSAQLPDSVKIKVADYVINNDGDLDHLEFQVNSALRVLNLTEPA